MLRHLYRCALRLHPPGFRQRFGEELLSIFDKAEGRLAAFRLVLDAVGSLSRQWLFRPEFWSEIGPRSIGRAGPRRDPVVLHTRRIPSASKRCHRRCRTLDHSVLSNMLRHSLQLDPRLECAHSRNSV